MVLVHRTAVYVRRNKPGFLRDLGTAHSADEDDRLPVDFTQRGQLRFEYLRSQTGRQGLPCKEETHDPAARITEPHPLGPGVRLRGIQDRLPGSYAPRAVLRAAGEVHQEPDNHFCFDVTDEEGVAHSVPYHRVKEVWQDGELIWRREL
jgi:uncharacterized protein (UPF0248 family)